MTVYLKILIILLTVVFGHIISLKTPLSDDTFDQELYKKKLDPVKCEEQMNILLNNIALGMLFVDASGKIPSGILSGNLASLGSYYECLNIQDFEREVEIEGKYCMINIPLRQFTHKNVSHSNYVFNDVTMDDIAKAEIAQGIALAIASVMGAPQRLNAMQLSFSLGVCIPKVCQTKDVVSLLGQNIPNFNTSFTHKELFCRVPNDKPYSIADYMALVIFPLLALVTLISTSYDLYHIFVLHTESSQIKVLYQSFSVYTNTRRFLTFNSVPGTLECVDGIRAISMLWVIVGHVYASTLTMFVSNLSYISEYVTSIHSTWLTSALISVDTFFTLSGIFCVYSIIGYLSRNQFMTSLHFFYIHRLFRIFPLLVAVILLQASILHKISDGPLWYNMGHNVATCRNRWWSTLLHVQNYVKPLSFCLYHSWYLSVDLQLYIMSPIVIIWLFGSRRIAWCVLTAGVLISLIISSIYSFMYNYPASIFSMSQVADLANYISEFYINTLTRASPFMVGLAYGYLLHLYRGKRVQMNKILVFVSWLLALALMAFCIFSAYPLTQVDHDNQMFDNFLNAYMKAMWALAIGWMIFASAHGYGGPINWFLSLQMWKILSRLSYAMYLIHLPLIMVVNGSVVDTYYFTVGDTMFRAFGIFGCTVIASFILCILVDAPFSTIQKQLLGKGFNKSEKEKNKESQTVVIEDNKEDTRQ